MRQNVYNQRKDRTIDVTKSINRRLRLGGSMVLDPYFDIRKYIDDVEKQFEIEKRINNLPNHKKQALMNDYKIIEKPSNNKNFQTINNDLNSSTRKRKNPIKIPSNEIIINTMSNKSMKNIDELNFPKQESENHIRMNTINTEPYNPLTFLDYKGKSTGSKGSSSIFNKKRKEKSESDEDNVNIFKIVHEIRQANENSRKDKSIEKIFNDKIAFSRIHEDVVFEPTKLINNYERRKETELREEEGSLNDFVKQNKDIFKHNRLIDILNSEKAKLYSNMEEREKGIKNNYKTIENCEKKFENYKEIHKRKCKEIDGTLIQLVETNNKLVVQRDKSAQVIREREDEIRKRLTQIEELRKYAQFVNRIFGGPFTKFDAIIFPPLEEEPELNVITKNCIDNYSFLENNDDENINFVLNFIKDPQVMDDKFNELEAGIMRIFKAKNEAVNEIIDHRKSTSFYIDELQEKCDMLQDEYNTYKKIYDQEKECFDEFKGKNTENAGLDDLIKDLYFSVIDTFNSKSIFANNNSSPYIYSYENGVIKKQKKESIISAGGCIGETKKILSEKEKILNDLYNTLESYEQNDEAGLLEAINIKKWKEIKKKQALAKENVDSEKNSKARTKALENASKIYIFSRKTEPPYHVPKKKQDEKVDESLLEQEQNEQLLNYY